MAARALAADVAVSEELLGLRIIELLGCLLDKLAIVIEMTEEIRSQLMVGLARGTRIDIKSDAKSLERVFDDVVVAIYYFLGSDTLFACTNGDWYTMFVATADKEDILAFETQIAHIDVRWYIHTRQVANMYRTIGIRKGCGYKCSLKCHNFILFDYFLCIQYQKQELDTCARVRWSSPLESYRPGPQKFGPFLQKR